MNARRTFTTGAEALSRATSGTGARKPKVRVDDRALELEYELERNRAGQPRPVNLADNGVVVTSGTFITAASSGSFAVRRVVADRAGSDRFTATATNAATGATCRGALTFAG